MTQKKRRHYLIKELLKEVPRYREFTIPSNEEKQKELLRGLFNLRQPKESSEEFLRVQDAYLQQETKEKGIVSIESLNEYLPGIYLWQGDITRLQCDAIVNASNSALLGCFFPNHRCIDNAIHTYSGVQLRLACAKLMEEQGHEEPTGRAKITKAYNLPSKWILHTVGPIVTGEVTEENHKLLSSSYLSCLELAARYEIESIAFCCISTGEFRFPNELAAEIALETVLDFMKNKSSVKKVIFNVFKDKDREIYERLLDENKSIKETSE